MESVPKHLLEDGLNNHLEVLWERNIDFGRKNTFIIQLILDPGHQIVNILRSRTGNWFFDLDSISPQVLIPGRLA